MVEHRPAERKLGPPQFQFVLFVEMHKGSSMTQNIGRITDILITTLKISISFVPLLYFTLLLWGIQKEPTCFNNNFY